MRFSQRLDPLLLDQTSQNLSKTKRVPHQWSTSQLIRKSVSSIHHRPELNHMSVENVRSDLRAHMQQNLQIPFAQTLLMHNQLSQLNQPNPKYIVRHIRLKNLTNVVHDSLCVEILVKVQRVRRVLELRDQNRFKNNQTLSTHLPPRISHHSLQSRQLLVYNLFVRQHHVAEQTS